LLNGFNGEEVRLSSFHLFSENSLLEFEVNEITEEMIADEVHPTPLLHGSHSSKLSTKEAFWNGKDKKNQPCLIVTGRLHDISLTRGSGKSFQKVFVVVSRFVSLCLLFLFLSFVSLSHPLRVFDSFGRKRIQNDTATARAATVSGAA
jgi:hypothetical protein